MQQPTMTVDERNWGMFCHLAALAGFVLPAFGGIIGPLIVWLIKKDEYPFVNDQGKESLNFQITLLIAWAAAVVLIIVGIGIILLPAIAVIDIILIIMATIQANKGVAYRYPFAIRLIG